MTRHESFFFLGNLSIHLLTSCSIPGMHCSVSKGSITDSTTILDMDAMDDDACE